VTIIPTADGVRLACNRDESRRRPAATPPQQRRFGARTALLPIDPAGGGTWLGASDAPLVLVLLNANPAGRPTHPAPRSRGLIIPGLLGCGGLDEVREMVAALDPREYSPFRLVAMHGREFIEFRSDSSEIAARPAERLAAPVLFTSSGLGDALVEGPRRALFETFFTPGADWVARQDAFHRHSWPDREHLSVCMRRTDARTVSHSVVEVGPRRLTFTYYADAPDQPVAPSRLSLDIPPGGSPV
jgi:hypothetical protein